MDKKTERARDIATKAILFICEDDAIKLMWQQTEPEYKKKITDKIITFASSQLEEYAGNRPMEPTNKVILVYPDWIYDRQLYLKDSTTGALELVKLVKGDYDADKSTPESTV